MSELASQMSVLRNFADASFCDAIERVVGEGKDRELIRINALAFADRHGADHGGNANADAERGEAGAHPVPEKINCYHSKCGEEGHTGVTLRSRQMLTGSIPFLRPFSGSR